MDPVSALYGDDPIVGTQGESERKNLVDRLARSLGLMHDRTESAVVALVGPWGSGKTTVLNAVEASLKTKGRWLTARYNPWSYSSLEAAIPGFFAELNSVLPEELQKKGTRKKVGSWISKAAPLGTLGSVAGVDGSGAIDLLGRLVSGDESPEQLRAQVVEDLRGLKQPVIMLIDDLDRLGPDELLTTFKLVRMLGRLPNVYYLLCYDEATLVDVLMRTGLVHDDAGRARAYLEKMIQLRLDIPSMLVSEQLGLLNSVLREVQTNHAFELLPHETQRLSKMWGESMRPYLSQPRAIKRLFTQVDATWAELQGEVDFADYVAMTFIRTFEPPVLRLIEDSEAELLGFDHRWVDESDLAKIERWQKKLDDLDVVHAERILDLLAELFLPLKSAREKISYGPEARTDVARRSGVGHADYFHRYTQAAVPKDDLPNSKVSEALSLLREGRAGTAIDLLEEFLSKDASMVVQKIMNHDLGDLPVEPLAHLLARQYDVIGKEGAGLSAGPPSFELLVLGRHMFTGLQGDPAIRILSACSTTSSGIAFVADLLRDLGKTTRAGAAPEWLPEARNMAATAIEAQFRALDPNDSDSEVERALRNVWALRDFTAPESARALVWELIDADKGWNAATFIAMLYPIGQDSRGKWSIDRYHLSADGIETVLGFDKAVAAIKSQGPVNSAPGELEKFDSRPSLTVRVACVYEDILRLDEEVSRAP
ncbi:P-loop NTPase fold protein [Paenarthrobacter sp. NPDC058040]|uniref:KAP family P-loop NTPase fold protein n=1 Tax=unclassified Paenarthrobacter TaxID=2634190 RepID=UPI0036DAFDF4